MNINRDEEIDIVEADRFLNLKSSFVYDHS